MSEARDTFHPVAHLADLADGELLAVVTPTGERICLARVGDEIHAVGDVCTHQAFPMSAGQAHADGTVECVWHGARFDCRTGAPVQGPATDALPVYAVELRDGEILVGPRRAPLPADNENG